MKESIFSRLFNRQSRSKKALTPEDIRRKLSSYQKQEGPAVFGGAQLYRVEEVEQQEKPAPLSPPPGR